MVELINLNIPWPYQIAKSQKKILPGGAYSIEMTHESTGQKFKVEVEMRPFELLRGTRVHTIRLKLRSAEKVRRHFPFS